MTKSLTESYSPLNTDLSRYQGQALICLTYDDGLLDNYTLAVPSHLKYKVPATFAIIVNRLLDNSFHNKFINITQMQDMEKLGFEISSHGYYHKKKFPELNDAELDLELSVSKKILEAFLSEKVVSICIPFGRANEKVIQESYKYYDIVRLFGYRGNELNQTLKSPMDAYPILNNTEINKIKRWIDNAIKDKKVITLMFHGIAEASENKGDYYFSREKLDEVLEYISSVGEDLLLPIRLCDLPKLQEMNKSLQLPKKKLITEKVLADEDNFMITLHENFPRSDKLVITFGGLPSGKTKKGFGTDFALSLGYDTIFVAQKEKTGYQGLSLDSFYKYISPHIHSRECVTYGSSLGGYCAIYYAGIINALAIAAAPKNSAHPTINRKQYASLGFLHDEIVDNPISKIEPVIIFDPNHNEETRYINNLILPAYPQARLVKVPFSGHTVLQTMKESRVLSDFMKTLIDKNQIIDFELKTDESYVWNAEKGRHLLKKGDKKGVAFLEKSLKLNPTKEAFEYLFNYYWKDNKTKVDEMIRKYIETDLVSPTEATSNKINKYLNGY